MLRVTYEKIDRNIKLIVTRIPLPLILVSGYFVRSFDLEMVIVLVSFIPYFFYNKFVQAWLFRQIDD